MVSGAAVPLAAIPHYPVYKVLSNNISDQVTTAHYFTNVQTNNPSNPRHFCEVRLLILNFHICCQHAESPQLLAYGKLSTPCTQRHRLAIRLQCKNDILHDKSKRVILGLLNLVHMIAFGNSGNVLILGLKGYIKSRPYGAIKRVHNHCDATFGYSGSAGNRQPQYVSSSLYILSDLLET